jgi:hypothetical protein
MMRAAFTVHPMMMIATIGRSRLSLASGVLAAFALGGAAGAEAGQFGISVDGGYHILSNAPRSAKAVFGDSSGGFTGGGSLRYTFGRGLFLAAGARYFAKTGERVFTLGHPNPVFRLGHPLELQLTPMYLVAGYRLERRRGLPLAPYVALGGGAYRYHEESLIGGLTEGVLDQTKGAGYAMLGLEYGRGLLRLGVEATYSIVPSSADLGGVSSVYDEDDIGGFTIVGKLTFVP